MKFDLIFKNRFKIMLNYFMRIDIQVLDKPRNNWEDKEEMNNGMVLEIIIQKVPIRFERLRNIFVKSAIDLLVFRRHCWSLN